ncbi:oxidoreductase [Longispora fulva]|uniref:PhzF family phenazine biosynthesis protein n=1 Tax=Longispora fulva TaxID=619741 RepID=A0A8J7GU75_9ACTN|nr:PhzF family phenazine biosynthesis isomerase [Longispora fulva]MBG6138539.1 PhzF family phenazine biosynthesis protein [Longispora fulva]GIG62355.1 oxidoreductase [Longispora fulva]
MTVLRYAAFTRDPAAGNPAGVVLDADLTDAEMLAIAAEVGYSETAFLTRAADGWTVRYFSPKAEVPFCGHATIASAVAVAERVGPGPMLFHTQAGEIPVVTSLDADGQLTATLTSVPPTVAEVPDADLAEALAALGWSPEDLDAALPPRIGFAGARHLILAAATRDRLAKLDYDFERLRNLMLWRDWTTVKLVWRAAETEFHVRDAFPVGGVVEDPATGASAAALGGYLRALGLIQPPVRLSIHQGEDLGRPGHLTVDVPEGTGGIRVTGNAVAMG